jgi:hypothetical protein
MYAIVKTHLLQKVKGFSKNSVLLGCGTTQLKKCSRRFGGRCSLHRYTSSVKNSKVLRDDEGGAFLRTAGSQLQVTQRLNDTAEDRKFRLHSCANLNICKSFFAYYAECNFFCDKLPGGRHYAKGWE